MDLILYYISNDELQLKYSPWYTPAKNLSLWIYQQKTECPGGGINIFCHNRLPNTLQNTVHSDGEIIFTN